MLARQLTDDACVGRLILSEDMRDAGLTNAQKDEIDSPNSTSACRFIMCAVLPVGLVPFD